MLPDNENTPPTAQKEGPGTDPADETGWLERARQAYRSSTDYVNSNFRKMWDDSIRAFNNQHPSDSKYNTPAFDKRSRLFRPKIRAVIRKNEAAAAAAFFSNMDVVSLDASDQSDKAQLMSADIMKQLVQYRLTRTIPWFQTLLGGIQDAQTIGSTVAHVYWDYDATGPEKVDRPCIDLIPLENVRFDPSASWIDPVNTSPYWIHLIPMYAMDVKARMDSGEWTTYALTLATGGHIDSTRVARNAGAQDPQADTSRGLTDYEICWIQRHIHRRDGQDWEFYTLGEHALLTEALPLKDVVFHGKRPYVMGCVILEAHKTLPTGVPNLGRGIEDESNEIANQRIDNVKFALNKKWFAKRGVEVDLAALVRNVPGGVVLMNDPDNDVREISWPDVTQSSYMEQQQLDLSMDELLGNFNPAALMTAGAGNAPARNMAMLNQSNGTLVEYLIRTFVETFVQPVLRQLVLLEQKYETDRVILGLAAKNAPMLQRFGVDQVTDELLEQEITLNVNVGMGATDPTHKLQKFLTALTSYSAILKNPTPGMNVVEVGKEIFGHLGYSDGSRFFTIDDPQVAMLQQQLQMAAQEIQKLQAQVEDKHEDRMMKFRSTRETNQTKIITTKIQEEAQNKRELAKNWTALTTADAQEKSKDKDAQRKLEFDRESKALERKDKQKERQQDLQMRREEKQMDREDRRTERTWDREDRKEELKAKAAEKPEKPEPKKDEGSDKSLAAMTEVLKKLAEGQDALMKAVVKSTGPKKIVLGKDGSARVTHED